MPVTIQSTVSRLGLGVVASRDIIGQIDKTQALMHAEVLFEAKGIEAVKVLRKACHDLMTKSIEDGDIVKARAWLECHDVVAQKLRSEVG